MPRNQLKTPSKTEEEVNVQGISLRVCMHMEMLRIYIERLNDSGSIHCKW